MRVNCLWAAAVTGILCVAGPVGAAWIASLGAAGVIALSLAALALWSLIPTLLAWWRFRRTQAWSSL